MIILYNRISHSTAERPKLQQSLITLVQCFSPGQRNKDCGKNRLKTAEVTASFFHVLIEELLGLNVQFLQSKETK